MGIKLEYILLLLLMVTIIVTTTIKLDNAIKANSTDQKELEFFSTTFTEVDKNKTQARLFGTYGIRHTGILEIDNIKYTTDSLKLLLANKAKYKENTLYLDGNVRVEDMNGSLYKTEHAIYNQKTEVLILTSSFEGIINNNVIKGSTLHYNIQTKEVNATAINAVIYTINK